MTITQSTRGDYYFFIDSCTRAQPTPSTVCRRLVEKHTILRDKVDNGLWWTVFASTSKNRPDRADITVPPVPPATRKAETTLSSMANVTFHSWSGHTKVVFSKYDHSHGAREWIKTEGPTVKQILEKFPCLGEPRIVRWLWLCVTCSSFAKSLELLRMTFSRNGWV